MDPISYFQAIVLGLLQGVSELFPISSLGHSVVLPRVFGWNIHQNDDYFLSFLVATHCATAIVLFFFFLKDWVRIIKGVGRSLRDRYIDPDDTVREARLADRRRDHPRRPARAPARAPAADPVRLDRDRGDLPIRQRPDAVRRGGAPPPCPGPLAGEHPLRRDASPGSSASVPRSGSGPPRPLALIPGLSRSGASMSGGLLAGLSNEEAARFAFLLATPIIGAAGLLKLPDLLGHQGDHVRGQALVGAIAAAITAYFSVKFLLRFFETNRLTPFAIYCCAVGAILSIAFALS